jgi:hypothetical protein
MFKRKLRLTAVFLFGRRLRLTPPKELKRRNEERQRKEGTVPLHDTIPGLDDILKLRRKPAKTETREARVIRNRAFTFLVEHVFGCVAGRKREWDALKSCTKVSDTNLTRSDEAFAVLLLENMWDQYVVPNGEDGKNPTQPKKGRYTSAGSNRRHGGWSKEGIERFNDLAKLVARNRLEDWADTVEGEVMKDLRSRLDQTDGTERKKRKRKETSSDNAAPVRPVYEKDLDSCCDP